MLGSVATTPGDISVSQSWLMNWIPPSCNIFLDFMRLLVRSLSIMVKHEQFISAFTMLREHKTQPDETYLIIEHFVCSLSGQNNMHSVDTVRSVMFQNTYAPSKRGGPLGIINDLNQSSLPPCRSVMTKKTMKANYVASLWNNALRP